MKGAQGHLGRLDKRLNVREDRGAQNIPELQNLVTRRMVKCSCANICLPALKDSVNPCCDKILRKKENFIYRNIK